MNDDNVVQFAHELFIKPNVVLSMILKDSLEQDVLLLYFIGLNNNVKMLNCLWIVYFILIKHI